MMHRYSFTVEGQSCNFMKKLCLQLALFPLVFFCPNDRAQAQQKKPVAEYTVTQWASDPAIARGVAISVSDRGAAYVTTAFRRKQSSLDIRRIHNWVKTDLSFTSVEDRRAHYRANIADLRGVPDRDKNGVSDWKDLTVQKDGVVQVVGKDGDGSADQFKIVDTYSSEVTGIPAGVLAVGA
ncbi:MAG TPA: hypothetical protein DHV60_00870, partial [Verrucomicrobiales bacterium]|nr:hypothetical protein [Verrucomicrobiales bacterium]